MEKSELLIELGSEEIPASLLEPTARDLANTMLELLKEERLGASVQAVWYTPRRIVIGMDGIPARQEDVFETINGPARSVAFDAQGQPTRAALGFAQKHGVEVSALQAVSTAKGEYLAVVRRIKGEATRTILQRLLPIAIGRLTFPKTMHWSPDKFRFTRPLRWIVALFDRSVLKFRIADVSSSRYSSGHRFLGKRRIPVSSLEDLRERLRANGVIVDPAEREDMIRKGLAAQALACGGHLLQDSALLQTVVNLNEFPSVISGSFEPRFLGLPQEILITVMREHQKYFSILDAGERLLPAFLAVINLPAENASLIRAGHERVLRARLADAAFFWDTDRKARLAEREARLKNVVFQEKLGSYFEKQTRVSSLVPKIAAMTRTQEISAEIQEAAHLFKCDLITEMVKEFTDLQGIVGGLYAHAEGYGENVWRAIYEQYQPKSTSSPSPSTRAGALLSLADRLDTVCGCFSVGLIPSSSGDPFAVRRQANGLLKIIFDHNLNVSLEGLVGNALANFGSVPAGTAEELKGFFEGRIRFLFEEMGFAYDCVNAALASGFDEPVGALDRVRALVTMRDESDFLSLASNFKRVVNILAQAGPGQGIPDPALMTDPEELALWESYEQARPKVVSFSRDHDYGSALRTMASMRQAVDLFFDKVLVMAPDPEIKNNRLALLRQISDLFLGVADISQIVLERASRVQI